MLKRQRRRIVGPQVVYYVQSRSKCRDGWDEWCICSPHYETCREAREQFNDQEAMYFDEEVRLVRGKFWHERVPIKTPLCATHRSQIKVLGIRRLKPQPPYTFTTQAVVREGGGA